MSQIPTITGISFSSGGARACGNIGVLTCLLDAGILGSVKAWYGCSAGSFCAFLGALGATASWWRDCCKHFDLKYSLQIQQTLVLDYLKTWGVSSGTDLTEFLGSFIDTWEPGATKWTFADLARERPGIFLGITASNLSTRKLIMFSVETHPEMLILDAIRASCSIPFVYVPWISKSGDMYCDGAIIEQCPWIHVKDKQNCLVIACSQAQIFGDCAQSKKIDSFMDYCMRIVLLCRSTMSAKPRYWIAVENTTVGSLSLDLTEHERQDLFSEGEAAASNWLKELSEVSESGIRQSKTHSETSLLPLDYSRKHIGTSYRRWSV